MTLRERLRAAAALLTDARALLDDRLASSSPWASYLLDLNDDQLDAIEGAGLHAPWPQPVPAELRALLDRIAAVVDVPVLLADEVVAVGARRHERPHKQAQIDAFVRVVHPLRHQTARFVDVGSGHGHLTRALAAGLSRPGIGLEHNPILVDKAAALAVGSDVGFVVKDVFVHGLVVNDGDCLVGLHACGELGDIVMRAAAESTGDVAVAFVGCCLQKQRALVRTPLCGEGLEVPKALLGLSNLSTRDDGVEASRVDNVTARGRRLAVKLLLERAGVAVADNTELRGVNRRAAHSPLPLLAGQVFAARRLTAPTADDVVGAEAAAGVLHRRQRRLGVPRVLLARVLEVFVLLDRARFLEERGYVVQMGALFSPTVSPRNLAIVGSRKRM